MKLAPRTLGDALASLADGATVVAGGTDLMVHVNAGRLEPRSWLSLRNVEELRAIDRREGVVRVGAGVTFARVLRELPDLPLLTAAARTLGSPQIRNAATLGGNVATASPAGDSLPALACYDAQVELASAGRRRCVPLASFLLGPGRTALADDELIVAVELRAVSGRQWFSKVGPRRAMVIAVVSLAVRHDPVAGTAMVALGSAAPTARRAPGAEAVLAGGGGPDEFAAAVVAAASPIDDRRSSAAYRRHALDVLARRAHAAVA